MDADFLIDGTIDDLQHDNKDNKENSKRYQQCKRKQFKINIKKYMDS